MKSMIGRWSESNDLYYLKEFASPTICSISIPPLQIHYHLGHPSPEKLKILIPNLSSVSSLECESCQLGKVSPCSLSYSCQWSSFNFISMCTSFVTIMYENTFPLLSILSWLILVLFTDILDFALHKKME